MINPPIYRLTTAVSDIDQTNINRDIRDGNWLSKNTLPFCLDVESAYPSALEPAEVQVEVVDQGDQGGDCAVTGHPEFLQGAEAHWIQGVLGAEGRKADGADGATRDVGQPGPEVGPTRAA